MKNTRVNSLVNKILEGRSVREALMQATIKDPVTGKYVDVDFENPWDKSSDKSYKVSDIFDYATLLSIEEYKKYKSNIPRFDGWWWLCSPGRGSSSVAVVGNNDRIVYDGFNNNVTDMELSVRPALHLEIGGESPFSVGDGFSVEEYDFTVISKYYALCDDDIGVSQFRESRELGRMYKRWIDGIISDEVFYKYCDEINANDYAESDVKRKVDKWFNKNKGASIEIL